MASRLQSLASSRLNKIINLLRNKYVLSIAVLMVISVLTLAIGARLSGNDAFFVSQSVPATMTAGEIYSVNVKMLNQGTTTWTPGQLYRLGSQNPHDNGTWGGRIGLEVGESVAPDAIKTFSFTVKAPSSPGSYNFQWRMVQDGVEWFGAWTPNIAVQVVPRNNSHLSKIKEYVYAGGRLVSSEEKSCVPTLSPSSANLPKGESTGTVNVSVSSGCLWSAVSNADWITVTSGSGTGNGVVNYSVSLNNSGAQRSGTLTVNNKSFTIIQSPDAGSCNYTLNKSSESFSANAGNGSFTFSTGEGCTWTATSSVNWITITSSTSGSGSETINYSVASNPGSPRSGTITVGGKTFTINQALNPGSCSYSLNKYSESFSEQGGNGSFVLNVGTGCPWNATSNASWLSVTSATNGTGGTTISYTAAANSGQQRSGTITVGGQNFIVTQAPNQASCSFALSPGSAAYSTSGGSGSFSVSTGAGCQWDAATGDGWIRITGGGTGIGNGTVSYSVDTNSGDARTGSISVRGQIFTISQELNQTICTFSFNPSSNSYEAAGGSGSFSVSTGTGCQWSATSNVSWISVTGGGTGNGTVSYSVQANGGGSRTGTISVRGQNFTITQKGCGALLSNEALLVHNRIASCDGRFDINMQGDGNLVLYQLDPFRALWASGTFMSNVAQASMQGDGNLVVYDTNWVSHWDSKTAGNPGAWLAIQNNGNLVVYTAYGTPLWSSGTQYIPPSDPDPDPTPDPNPPCCYQSPYCECFPETYSSSSSTSLSSTNTEQKGLTARYYSNATLSGQPSLQRIDPNVNFNWDGETMKPPQKSNYYSSRWSGKLFVPFNEAYTFYLKSDGDVKLWINSQLVINRSKAPAGSETRSIPIQLKAGTRADIRVEYYNPTGKFILSLLWSSSSTSKKVIPGKYFYPEASTNQSGLIGSIKQIGRLLPPQGSILLALLIICTMLFILLKLKRNGVTRGLKEIVVKRVISPSLFIYSCLKILRIKVARIFILITNFTSAYLYFFSLKLKRPLAVILILILASPMTSAQVESARYEAQAIWKNAVRYISTISVAGNRSVRTFSAAMQTEQVADLQICPKQLVMYVGERYTLNPIPLDSNLQVVNGVGMQWMSFAANIAKVSSFGQVEAIVVGTTTVEVQAGNVTKQIPVEVRSGTRPVGSNQEADVDTSDCSSGQSAMSTLQATSAIDETVQLDWDPEPIINSRATQYYNAVGNPKFYAKSGNVQLGSNNYQFNVPVTSIGGRGASASIGMTFNSRVWNIDNGKMTFNYVGSYPAPGWSMGYGKIIRNYNATATGDKSGKGNANNPGDYLLVSGSGTRTHLKANYDSIKDIWLHEIDDGSFLQFNPVTGEMRYPDGSKMIYSSVNGALLPTAMINTNGGVITIGYKDYCEGPGCLRVFRHRTALSHVRDTLGRYVTFHYYGDADYPADSGQGRPEGELAAIKAPDMNGALREIFRVEYQGIPFKYDFGSMTVDAPANNSMIQVVRRIYYPQTGKGILFTDYSSYGMPRKISHRYAMNSAGGAITDGTERAYTKYNYLTIDPSDPYNRNQAGSLNDFPKFTRREEWWLGKTDANGAPTTEPAVYEYSNGFGSTTESNTVKHLGRDYEEVTTTGNNEALTYGRVISVESKKSSTGAILRKQIYSYTEGTAGEPQIEKVETIDETGQGTQVSFAYGPYGRMTDQYEYGFKQGADYLARRRTHYDFIDYQSYLNEHFLRLVRQVTIYDAGNTIDNADDQPKAKTESIYDDYAAMGGMKSYSIYPPNHDTEYNQSKTLRANVTGVRTFSKLNPEESTLRQVKYDIFGNMVEAEVSCCMTKSFTFTEATWYSQPRSIRSGNAGELNLETFWTYNFFTGLVLEETSPEGQVTKYDYDNALRPWKVLSPTGAIGISKLEQDSYGNDLLTHISQTNYDDEGTEKIITSKQWMNGAGQVLRAGTGTGDSPASYDMTRVIYDEWGRSLKHSNPYSGDSNGNAEASFNHYWTTNTYDELSRVIKVTLPDNQVVETSYDGATVIGVDTVGRKRKSEVDGLGRLIKVTEPNPANGNLEWATNYSYDIVGNLVKIDQGGQLRSFIYDAKGRLLTQTLPESGETKYTYTDFDAVHTKTDARSVVTTYNYGVMNLLTGVSYNTSNAAGVASTSPVALTYNTESPGKGQLATITDGAGSESNSFDSLGRLISSTRTIDGVNYQKQYKYNNIGQLTQMTYPSGKRVKVTHDDRGRLNAIQGLDTSDNVQQNYLSDINYRTGDGFIISQKTGDGAVENFGYSSDRLQLTSQSVMKDSNTLMSLNYGYQADAGKMGSGTTAGNTGQLTDITGTVNGNGRNQSFTYDNVGRLTTATGWSSWQRRYELDRYGNRTGAWDSVSGGNQIQNTIIQEVSGAKTNRIASLNGVNYMYDASGNVTSDGSRTLTYDALNRVVNVGGENYSYNAANQRLKKESGGVITHYIWEGSSVIAEYEYGGSSTPAQGTRYYHQDRLSTRVITDSNGNVVGTSDQVTFGGEVSSSGESEKHKYTTYERDNTGLDYAVNRHYASWQGRFMQVDPIGMASVSLGNPQTLNLYGYCVNDPVNSVDPLGLECYDWGCNIRGSISSSGGGGGGSSGPQPEVGNEEFASGGGSGGDNETEPEPQEPETDCSRLADSIVKQVEASLDWGFPGGSWTVGHDLLFMARDHARRLGNADHTFGGFKAYLTDEQNDGVFQHVLAHAGATVIGSDHLMKFVKDNTTGGKLAVTGYQLTNYALQEDERQRDTATDPRRRRENVSEIADDHAGRSIGADINKFMKNELNRDQLGSAIFNTICQ